MPRQRASATRRPTVPARPAPPPTKQQQSRPASTYAGAPATAPQAQQYHPAQAQSSGPGLFGQMASTAAGVAVGSSIGHAIGGLFGGGSSAPAESAPAQPPQTQQTQAYSSFNAPVGNCQDAAQQFTKCLDDQGGNMQTCNWYLEQWKACQAAMSQ